MYLILVSSHQRSSTSPHDFPFFLLYASWYLLCAGYINLDTRADCGKCVACAFYCIFYTLQYDICSCTSWSFCWYHRYCRSVFRSAPILQLQIGWKTSLFQLLSHHQKSPAGHCVCLTFSLVVYTPQIHYQPPPAPTSYKYVREHFIYFHNLSGALQHLFLWVNIAFYKVCQGQNRQLRKSQYHKKLW